MKFQTLFFPFVLFLALFGAGLYWAVNYAYYEEINYETYSVATDQGEIRLNNVRILQSDNTPLKMRICADEVDMTGYEPTDDGHALVAPKWFNCFDAKTIDAGIEAGEVKNYRIKSNDPWGFDMFLATGNGGSWIWRELNECGEKQFAGKALPQDCPPFEE